MQKKKKEFKPLTEEEIGLTSEDIKCAEYRGKVIHCMIEIELLTENVIIRNYFNKNNHRGLEFIYSVLTRENFTLASKLNAMKFILHQHFPGFVKEHPYFIPTYNELIEIRNIYAHRTFFKPLMRLLHHTTIDNKMTVKDYILSDKNIQMFYGKYFVIYNDLKDILELITKEAKK